MDHTQVLVVGAGPTGLMLAAELHRRGTAVRIVDKHPGVLEATKAAALHARALEHFRDLGVADRIVAEGQRIDILQLRTGYRDRVRVDFRAMPDTRYPHMVDIPQARTEHILLEHLTAAGVVVERGWELTGLAQGEHGVTATFGPRGTAADPADTRSISATWVVGADGVHSTVRELLGLEFLGADYPDDWVLADAVVDWPLPRNEMTFSGDDEGIYGVFPLPGERRYRLAYTQTRDRHGRPVPPDLADAQQALRRTGVRGTVRSVDEFWTFNLAHRQAPHVRRGRVFLAGDAGHVHTPFGGQGLNLGIGDAVNLAWKLAEVCAGRAPTALLDTYEPERHLVARQVVTFTHLGAEAMLLGDGIGGHQRDLVFRAIQHTPARHLMARRLSQLAHTYRGTPLAHGRAARLHGGDRLPDVALFDGLRNQHVRLHDATPTSGYTLLVAGHDADDATRTAALAEHLQQRWRLDLHPLLVTTSWQAATRHPPAVRVLLDRGRQARALYARGATCFLVRPDRHIGYAGAPQLGAVERYLATIATIADGTGAEVAVTAVTDTAVTLAAAARPSAPVPTSSSAAPTGRR